MKKLVKSKKGFTLVEIILVVAIIVILAAAVFINVSDILNRTKNSSDARAQEFNDYKTSVSANEVRIATYGF